MRKIFFFMVFFSPILSCYSQRNILPSEAAIAARNWMSVNSTRESNEIKNINTIVDERGTQLLYEIMFDSTTLLLSGNRNCVPILVTCQSYGESIIDTTNEHIPCGLKALISDFIRQIALCLEEENNNPDYAAEWSSLLNGDLGHRSFVNPLIKTMWNQDWSNSGNDPTAYNYFCVADSGCTHYPVGCGAVAMGQVMNYWNYPLLSYNRPEQIDWCNMKESLDVGMPNYDKCRDAIANFLFDCANDINTDFSCQGSISNLSSIYNALVGIYGYSALPPLRRGGNDTEWIERIRSDLDNGYPVIYRGADENDLHGHFFILDGYDSDGKFHINWGWGGCADCYAYLGNFVPNNNYNYHHWAIFKIRPPYHGDFCNQELSLDEFYSIFYSNSGNSNLQPWMIVPQTMTTLTSASITSDSSWRTISAGVTAAYQAHEEIELKDGFEAKYGCNFTAKIVSCAQCENNQRGSFSSNDVLIDDSVGNQPSFIDNEEFYAVGKSGDFITIDLFPNPTDGPLTMATEGMAEEVFVHDLFGRLVGGWDVNALTENYVTLDVSALHSGPYLLTVTTSSGTCTARFLRK